jgi:3-dehydroquinate synthase
VLSRYRLRHGEAVAVGIALDSYYASRTGLMPDRDFLALIAGLKSAGLPVWHPLLESRDKRGQMTILAGLARFQEHLGGPLTITLPAPVGRRTEIHAMDPLVLQEGIARLKTLSCIAGDVGK